MTEEELAAIEARANAATPRAPDVEHQVGYSLVTHYPIDAAAVAAFVGAARQDVLSLIAEVRRLRAALAQYADESNWIASGEDGCSDDDQDRWHGDGEGFDLARAALGHKVK